MGNNRYTAKFKAEAVKQVLERGHGVVDVSKRLGISDKSLYLWLKQHEKQSNPAKQDNADALKLEVTRLKAELKRTTEERDILKNTAAYFAKLSEWSTPSLINTVRNFDWAVCAVF